MAGLSGTLYPPWVDRAVTAHSVPGMYTVAAGGSSLRGALGLFLPWVDP